MWPIRQGLPCSAGPLATTEQPPVNHQSCRVLVHWLSDPNPAYGMYDTRLKHKSGLEF